MRTEFLVCTDHQRPVNSRVVQGAIQTSARIHASLDGRIYIGRLGDIGADEDCLAAFLANLRNHFFAGFDTPPGKDNFGAFSGKRKRRVAAEARRAASD